MEGLLDSLYAKPHYCNKQAARSSLLKSVVWSSLFVPVGHKRLICGLPARSCHRLLVIETPRNWLPGRLAPRTGFEPVTSRLTAGRSTVELSGKVCSYGQLEYTPVDGGASIGAFW